MNFMEIAQKRQSCRKYDESKAIEKEKIDAILEAGRLAPSACNGQPYRFTVCSGQTAKTVARYTKGVGLNGFADQAPVMIVVSEEDYVTSAALGAKIKHNDYRSIDIGIAAAYMTAEATAQGIGSCILGWFDDMAIREVCKLEKPVRLVICLGYPAEGQTLRAKKRKSFDELVSIVK